MLKKFLLIMGLSIAFLPLEAAFKIRNGQLVDAEIVASLPVQAHFDRGREAIETENWPEAAKQFQIITLYFPNSFYAAEAYYLLGVVEFYREELDFANQAFSSYLKTKNNLKFFQEAIEYKFAIAQKLSQGTKRRFFGTKKLPKWASGKKLALEIFDEVIAAVPCHDLATHALYYKGYLLWNEKQYKQSIESFQLIIKRFPKHELAPESYLTISKIYLEQSRTEYQNPDTLEFSQINLKRFRQDFPRDERLIEVEKEVLSIKENYAKGLYETGLFYERVGKPLASIIYYQNAIRLFPETEIAGKCSERLQVLPSLAPSCIQKIE